MTEELREMKKDYVEITFYGWLLRAESQTKVDFYVYSLMVLRKKKSLLSKSIAAFISDGDFSPIWQ